MAEITFTMPAPNADARGDAPLLPAGEYAAKIDKWKVWPLGPRFDSPEAEKIGVRWATSYTITEGPHAGRFVRDGFDIKAPWDAGKELAAHARFAALCHAVGQPACKDTDDLVGAELVIRVEKLEAKGDYKAKNLVKSFLPIANAKPAAPVAPRAAPSFLTKKA